MDKKEEGEISRGEADNFWHESHKTLRGEQIINSNSTKKMAAAEPPPPPSAHRANATTVVRSGGGHAIVVVVVCDRASVFTPKGVRSGYSVSPKYIHTFKKIMPKRQKIQKKSF